MSSTVLYAPADDPAGGGGGGGDGSNKPSGGGDGSNKPPGGGEQPTGLTEQQIQKLIDKAINGRNVQFEAKQTKSFEELKTGLSESFATLLSETLTRRDEEAAQVKGSQGSPTTQDATQTPEFRKMQKQLDDATKKLEKAETERNQERSAKRGADFNRRVEAELTKLGITDPEGARFILQGRNRVAYKADDGDDIVFRDGKGVEDDLSEGLGEWVKSDEGKRYMPARGVSGSGDTPQGSNARRGTPPSNGQQPASPSRHAIGEALLAISGLPRS